jgi:hypothetical protein
MENTTRRGMPFIEKIFILELVSLLALSKEDIPILCNENVCSKETLCLSSATYSSDYGQRIEISQTPARSTS